MGENSTAAAGADTLKAWAKKSPGGSKAAGNGPGSRKSRPRRNGASIAGHSKHGKQESVSLAEKHSFASCGFSAPSKFAPPAGSAGHECSRGFLDCRDYSGLVSLHRWRLVGAGRIMRGLAAAHESAIDRILEWNAIPREDWHPDHLGVDCRGFAAFYGKRLAFWNPALAASGLAPWDQ